MLVSHINLRFCLDKAREISEHYNQNVRGSEHPKKLIYELQRICRDYLGKKIEVRILDFEIKHQSINGIFLRVNDEYEILLRKGLNPCWTRFVLCKELFHVILDEEQYQNISIFDHLEQAMVAFPSLEISPAQPVVSEMMAEIAAMEFMFPYADREGIRKTGAPFDCLAIAERYKVPQVMVEKYLSDSYMTNLGAFMPKPL